MSALLLLILCLIAGVLLRRCGRLSDDAPATLNAYVINLALPALALHHLHSATLSADLVFGAAGAWVMFGCAAMFFGYIARWAHLDAASTGALVLTGGLANTSFVGLPMIEAWIGPGQAMAQGIVIDQLGSYLALSTLGLLLAAQYSGQPLSTSAVGRRIVSFPPLIALAAALVLKPIAFPALLDDALLRLGSTVAPVALLSVGCQLRLGDVRGRGWALLWGLSYKLIVGPALVLLGCVLLWHGHGPSTDLARDVVVFEAAMGPMIGAAVVAGHFKLDARVAAQMVGIGVPLSMAVAPLWLAAERAV